MNKNRRRVLRVMAIGSGAFLAPQTLLSAGRRVEMIEWHGRALGADTSIQLFSNDKSKAAIVIEEAQGIIRKYEAMFSLYIDCSETSKLNRSGVLKNPSPDFVSLIKRSMEFSKSTNGAFDISVQPLWDVYQEHFGGDGDGELNEKINTVIENVGSDNISVNNTHVSFDRKNMAVSFNGIAQGFITDKVTEYLKEQSFSHTLVNMGEYRAIGPQENGDPWRIGLLNPFDGVSIADVLEVNDGAVATSGGYGNQFDASGRYHHLFDPHTGLSSELYASVTVEASDATTADALSTAFSNMTQSDIKKVLDQYHQVCVRLTDQNGQIHVLKA